MVDIAREEAPITITLTAKEAQEFVNEGYSTIPVNHGGTLLAIYEGLKAIGIRPFDEIVNPDDPDYR